MLLAASAQLALPAGTEESEELAADPARGGHTGHGSARPARGCARPVEQRSQNDAPEVDWNLPAGQSMQYDADPTVSRKVPGGQRSACDRASNTA